MLTIRTSLLVAARLRNYTTAFEKTNVPAVVIRLARNENRRMTSDIRLSSRAVLVHDSLWSNIFGPYAHRPHDGSTITSLDQLASFGFPTRHITT